MTHSFERLYVDDLKDLFEVFRLYAELNFVERLGFPWSLGRLLSPESSYDVLLKPHELLAAYERIRTDSNETFYHVTFPDILSRLERVYIHNRVYVHTLPLIMPLEHEQDSVIMRLSPIALESLRSILIYLAPSDQYVEYSQLILTLFLDIKEMGDDKTWSNFGLIFFNTFLTHYLSEQYETLIHYFELPIEPSYVNAFRLIFCHFMRDVAHLMTIRLAGTLNRVDHLSPSNLDALMLHEPFSLQCYLTNASYRNTYKEVIDALLPALFHHLSIYLSALYSLQYDDFLDDGLILDVEQTYQLFDRLHALKNKKYLSTEAYKMILDFSVGHRSEFIFSDQLPSFVAQLSQSIFSDESLAQMNQKQVRTEFWFMYAAHFVGLDRAYTQPFIQALSGGEDVLHRIIQFFNQEPFLISALIIELKTEKFLDFALTIEERWDSISIMEKLFGYFKNNNIEPSKNVCEFAQTVLFDLLKQCPVEEEPRLIKALFPATSRYPMTWTGPIDSLQELTQLTKTVVCERNNQAPLPIGLCFKFFVSNPSTENTVEWGQTIKNTEDEIAIQCNRPAFDLFCLFNRKGAKSSHFITKLPQSILLLILSYLLAKEMDVYKLYVDWMTIVAMDSSNVGKSDLKDVSGPKVKLTHR